MHYFQPTEGYTFGKASPYMGGVCNYPELSTLGDGNIKSNLKDTERLKSDLSPTPERLGRTPRGSCNRTLLRRVLRRFSNSKCFLEGFLEGAL